MVEPMKASAVRSVDDIPAVCLEDDLVAIFRVSQSDVRFWRKHPDFLPFPPLPFVDNHIRVSGCVVAWFLAQEAREYYRNFLSPLQEQTRKGRWRNRPPWWSLAPPHAEQYWATAIEGEKLKHSVNEVAAILRTTPSAVRRAVKTPGFPMPPASQRPIRWTEGQIERLLWAPQDHQEHVGRSRNSARLIKRR